jgi:hypothetical protein
MRLMPAQDLFARLVHYYKREGPRATAKRALVDFRRVLSGNRLVLFYCDLSLFQATGLGGVRVGRVERKLALAELDVQDLKRIVSVWEPRIIRRHMAERFASGASLWLLKLDDKLAGYGWTLVGQTIEPHFFPLGSNDVHLFDFFVFPECRGQRLNVSLVHGILATLAAEKRGRAFIEVAAWNTPQLRSLSRMAFQKLGGARKFCVLGKPFVYWG